MGFLGLLGSLKSSKGRIVPCFGYNNPFS